MEQARPRPRTAAWLITEIVTTEDLAGAASSVDLDVDGLHRIRAAGI